MTSILIPSAISITPPVISAFDYARFCKKNPGQKNRLLFVAHREEILEQSIETFRGVLKNLNFGDLWVGSYKPESLDHLFVSVQTLNSKKLYDELPNDYYDFLIVDEYGIIGTLPERLINQGFSRFPYIFQPTREQ